MGKLQIKLKTVLFTSAVLAGCASGEKKEACPTEAEEPISVCRAREKCQSENSSVGLGVGIGYGNLGFGVGRSQSTTRYERCLDRDLSEQQAKVKASQAQPAPASPVIGAPAGPQPPGHPPQSPKPK